MNSPVPQSITIAPTPTLASSFASLRSLVRVRVRVRVRDRVRVGYLTKDLKLAPLLALEVNPNPYSYPHPYAYP